MSCTFKYFFLYFPILIHFVVGGTGSVFIPDVTYKAGKRVLTHAQMLLDMYTS